MTNPTVIQQGGTVRINVDTNVDEVAAATVAANAAAATALANGAQAVSIATDAADAADAATTAAIAAKEGAQEVIDASPTLLAARDEAVEAATLLTGTVALTGGLSGEAFSEFIGGTMTRTIIDGRTYLPNTPLDPGSIAGQARTAGAPPFVTASKTVTTTGALLTVSLIDGTVVDLLASDAGEAGDALPAGGATGDILVHSGPVDRYRWQSLGRLAEAVANIMPPVTTPPPAPTNGIVGELLSEPIYVVGRGMAIDRLFYGAMRDNNEQAVEAFSRKTGAKLFSDVVTDVYDKDDHNGVSLLPYPDGTIYAVASGHNDNNYLYWGVLYPDGGFASGREGPFSGVTTYPWLFQDTNGRVYRLVRLANLMWVLQWRDSLADAWSAPRTIAQDAEQTYCEFYHDEAARKLYGYVRTNSNSPNYGPIRPIEMDLATGEFRDGNGGLGFLDGRASSNGKELPISAPTVATFLTPPSGREYGIVSWRGDVFILHETEFGSNTASSDLTVYRLTGADRYNPAHWTTLAGLPPSGGTMASITGYQLGWVLDPTVALPAVRVVMGRKVSGQTRIECWYNPDFNPANWQSTTIASLPATDGNLLCRPMFAKGCDRGTPVAYQHFVNFVRYDIYDSATCKFAALPSI